MDPGPCFVYIPAEVIIAEYDAILGQWQRENFYNHLSNYTNYNYNNNNNYYYCYYYYYYNYYNYNNNDLINVSVEI